MSTDDSTQGHDVSCDVFEQNDHEKDKVSTQYCFKDTDRMLTCHASNGLKTGAEIPPSVRIPVDPTLITVCDCN